jgi:hypothetical protein
MQKRAQAFQFPFDEWAKKGKPHNGAGTVIEAIDALAMTTENLSRQLLSEELVAICATHDEQEIAMAIREWTGDRPSRQTPLDALSQTNLSQPAHKTDTEAGTRQVDVEQSKKAVKRTGDDETGICALNPTHIETENENDRSVE